MSDETRPDGFAEHVVSALQASIQYGYFYQADKTGGLTLANVVGGTLAMVRFGIILAQRFPAEAALVAEALKFGDDDATEPAVDEVVELATVAAGKDGDDGK